MRTFIAAVVLSLISQFAFAQKNFEGKIIYNCSITGLDISNTEIFFGKQKLKIIEITNSDFKPQIKSRITDFAKGITYWIEDSRKTYFEILLMQKPFKNLTQLKPFPAKNRKIMGYNCSAYIVGSETEAITEMRMPAMTIYMWYADSLFYKVDEKYKNATGIEKATNGKNVGMGMEIVIGEDSSLEKIIAEPVSIITEAIPDSLFLVPAGYTLKTEKEIIQDNISSSLEVKDVQLSEVKKNEPPPPPPPPPPLLPTKQFHKKKKKIKRG